MFANFFIKTFKLTVVNIKICDSNAIQNNYFHKLKWTVNSTLRYINVI